MEQLLGYELDLTKIKGNGDFHCPKCGSIISPDDRTDVVYHIIGSEVADSNLREILVQCLKCQSTIRLTGFSKVNF